MILKGHSSGILCDTRAPANLHAVGVALNNKQVVRNQHTRCELGIAGLEFLHMGQIEGIPLNVGNPQVTTLLRNERADPAFRVETALKVELAFHGA